MIFFPVKLKHYARSKTGYSKLAYLCVAELPASQTLLGIYHQMRVVKWVVLT